MLRTLAPVGLILTGGGDIGEFDVSAAGPYAQSTVESLAPMRLRDRTESRLLSAALNAGIPVLAVCRGMQFVNRYFGGRVRSGISAPRGSHTKAGGEHRVRIDTNAAPQELSKLQPHATVRSYHDDGVLPADVAPSLAPWAWADDDVVEALSHTTHAVIGVQWHPEREPDHPWSAALMEPMVKRSRSQ